VYVGSLRPDRSYFRAGGSALLALFCFALTSCNTVPYTFDDKNDIQVTDKIRSLDLLPRYPKQVGSTDQSGGRRVDPQVYNGVNSGDGADNGTIISQASSRVPSGTAGDGFELNFENTPVSTVAKVVLGDIMQVGYTIDPRVQGTVSLASVKPVAKSDILFVLESALRLAGIALVHDTTGYRLVPLGDAVGGGSVGMAQNSTEPGYGISVVPLQYVSAPTLLKLLDSFGFKPGTVRAETGRNLLLIQGSGPDRQTAVDTAMSFDADWMHGQSVGIFPINNGNPEPIVAELEKIMDAGDNGLAQNVIKFQVVNRMNAILVISRKPALLETARSWIKRLDSANTARSSVHVYRVKYGEARQLAKVLTDMFIGSSLSGSPDAATNQLAPGSGATSTSSGLGGGSNGLSGINGSVSPNQSGGLLGALAAGPQQSNGGGLVANRGFGGANGGTLGAGANSLDARGGSPGNDKPILEGVRITADTVNNTLLIYADQANYRLIEGTVQQLDRPQLQVAIDATVAEVTLNDTLSYGVQTFLTSKAVGLKPDIGSVLNQTVPASAQAAPNVATTAVNALIGRALPGFNFLVGSEANPAVILEALHAVTEVKVLSNPSLVVMDNQVATLDVGDQVPIQTGSAIAASSTVVSTIDYRNTGIILRVAPRVSANGNVRLDIEQEISNVAGATGANAAPNLTPTVSQRSVKSSVSVASGQTVLLAGLISETRNNNRNGIPLLDDIPDLGIAFSNSNKSTTRTELIIFIRPQIIRDAADAHYVAEELRSKLRGTMKASVDTTPRVH
jgi:general secretion pathway protein D